MASDRLVVKYVPAVIAARFYLLFKYSSVNIKTVWTSMIN